jgi:hypothetical protein
VCGVGVGITSEWVTYTDFALATSLTNLAPPTGLDTRDGGGIWNGRDCVIVWIPSTGSQYTSPYADDVGDSNVAYYKVEVRRPDTTLLRAFDTAKGATEYTYFYGYNVDDNDGVPVRTLLFYVYSVDMFGQASELYATLSASNPAPDMSGGVPLITDKYGYLKISWINPTDNDMSHYVVYMDTVDPPLTGVKSIPHPDHTYDAQGLDFDTDYFFQIEPHDLFGPGAKTAVPAPGHVLKIPAINIDMELAGSMERTDSDENPPEITDKLYNGRFSTDGVVYTVAGVDKWIQYKYGVEDYFDRIGIWVGDANAQVYLAMSADGNSWYHFAASAEHAVNIDSDLVAAADQAAAAANFWQLKAGLNVGMLPNNSVARYVRLYLTGNSITTVYEFVPSRILISELAAIKHLSSYSANVGVITAGMLRSTDYSPNNQGLMIDLDDKIIDINFDGQNVFNYSAATGQLRLTGSVTITDGLGYENLTDRPADEDIYNVFGPKAWYGEEDPTMDNYPANLWVITTTDLDGILYLTDVDGNPITDADGDLITIGGRQYLSYHLGQYFTNTVTGKVFKFTETGWTVVTEMTVAESLVAADIHALALANEARDEAFDYTQLWSEYGATKGAPVGTFIGSVAAGDIAYWSSDPAARINAHTTKINGGTLETGSVKSISLDVLDARAQILSAGVIFADHIVAGEITTLAIGLNQVTENVTEYYYNSVPLTSAWLLVNSLGTQAYAGSSVIVLVSLTVGAGSGGENHEDTWITVGIRGTLERDIGVVLPEYSSQSISFNYSFSCDSTVFATAYVYVKSNRGGAVTVRNLSVLHAKR